MSFRSLPERLLQVAAGACLVMAVLWILGPSGADEIGLGDVPGSERVTSTPALSAWAAVPSIDALPSPDSGWHVFASSSRSAHHEAAAQGYAEPGFVARVDLYEPGRVQRWLYLALQVALWVAVAMIAWLLAAIARRTFGPSPFTPRNARRLRAIGVLVLVVSMLHSVGDHLVLKAMLDSSTLSRSFEALPYGIESPPWPALAAGVATLVIAQVWHRGAQLEAEVEDLV